MNKKVLITLAAVAMLTIPFSVFAAISDTTVAKSVRGFFGLDTSKLTDTQKADVKNYSQKMADLQKEFVNQMVTNGSITKEQGDNEIQKIDEALENGDVIGFPGGGGKGGFKGYKERGEFGIGGIDVSKLTDQQKADLKAEYSKITALQKEYINKQVASGLITQQQADTVIEKIDAAANAASEKGFFGKMGGFGCIGVGPMGGTSNLTEQQKTDLKEYTEKLAALQKELINKMVSNGAITKEQGDAAIQRMDEMAKLRESGELGQGMKMRKGVFGKQRSQQSAETQGTANPAL